jgi:uncharacterized protein (TIGR03382 family)
MGKAEALRQAQMEVREDYPNPYYWAGYVLSGEAGDVEASEAMLPWQTISIGIALVLIMVAGAWLVWRRRRITNTG